MKHIRLRWGQRISNNSTRLLTFGKQREHNISKWESTVQWLHRTRVTCKVLAGGGGPFPKKSMRARGISRDLDSCSSIEITFWSQACVSRSRSCLQEGSGISEQNQIFWFLFYFWDKFWSVFWWLHNHRYYCTMFCWKSKAALVLMMMTMKIIRVTSSTEWDWDWRWRDHYSITVGSLLILITNYEYNLSGQ